MHNFWVVARGGELDGAIGLLQTDGHPTGEHVPYRGERVGSVPYVVTDELVALPDGRSAYVAERELQ